jgi:hypothetical protein
VVRRAFGAGFSLIMGDMAGIQYKSYHEFLDPITHADCFQQAYRWGVENVNQKRRLKRWIH